MKTIKYLFMGALMTVFSGSAMAQTSVNDAVNAIKTNTVFVRQMDTHHAKNKAAPPPVNLTVIVIQVCIFFFKL